MSVPQELRVLEVGGGVAAGYAGKLLAEHGATVIKVEPRDGDALRQWGPFPDHVPDPECSGLFLALNTDKRSVCLDLPADAEALNGLLSWADILVHGLQPAAATPLGLDADTLAKRWPHLVAVAITPFGSQGPYADFQATELILANAGGWANICPATHADADLPPLKVYGEQCALMAALSAATTALATWRDTRRSGVGEFIDFSIQDYVASVLEACLPTYSYKGEVISRAHPRSLIPWRIFHAQDAPVFIVCVEQDQWERLVAFMGNPEWADLEIFADQPGRAENQDMVHTFVQEFVSQWTAAELYHAAQEHRICVAPVMDLAQLAANEHLRERAFFQTLTHPISGTLEYMAPAVLTGQGRAVVRDAAPRLGEHQDLLEKLQAAGSLDTGDKQVKGDESAAALPLSGIRVLDMTWAWAGPFCSMNLAHLGAQVIRLESPERPDLYRRLPIFPDDVAESLNVSGMFNQWNQGKTSIALDLSRAEGKQLVRELVAVSDVVVQNFATGVMERLGLGYASLREINPGIIMASISGYGQTGPYRHYMGYGPAIPPLTGLAAATGYVDGEAEEIGLSMPDPTAGITAAWGVVSALEKRQTTQVGEHLDITLWEATGVLNAEGWMGYVMNNEQPQRAGNRSTRMSPHGVFRCAGAADHWVAIACRSDAEWRSLAGLIDTDLAARFATLAERLAHQDEIEELVAAWAANKDRWDITKKLQAAKVPAFPTFSSADVVHDAHLNERGFIERLSHPEVGARPHTGIPWRLRNRPNGVRSPAPCIGAHTEQHLREILHYTPEHIQTLSDAGVITPG